MKKWLLAAAALALTAAAGMAQVGSGLHPPGAENGDWRRHEIVRVYRDNEGCRIRVISYHRPNGAIDTRQSRDCGHD